MVGKILVVGAAGNVGTPLVQALVAGGATVKAATRSGKPIAGAETIALDLGATGAFDAALDGVEAVYLLAPTGTMNVFDLLAPAVDAAAKRRVKVVLQTALGVDADEAIPYRRVERRLESSGTPYVVLRPNWFADNFHTFWRAGLDHGVIAVPAGDGRSSFIDTRDIAASAAAALTSPRFDGHAFDLTGPEALGYADAAAILSDVVRKPIRYTPIDDAAFIDMLAGAGVPRPYAEFLAGLFHPVRGGWTARVTDHVAQLTGRAPRSLRTYASDNAAALSG
jgi:uncharacterized protein YbjT (DUF2867 family)